jgi:hypothetical protein
VLIPRMCTSSLSFTPPIAPFYTVFAGFYYAVFEHKHVAYFGPLPLSVSFPLVDASLYSLFLMNIKRSWVPVAHTCGPSYLGS